MTSIELIAISFIILLQLYAFVICWKKIRDYAALVPKVDNFYVGDIKMKVPESKTSSYFSVSRIEVYKEDNAFEPIKKSINKYLLKNKGASSDFSLIKDIIERNIAKYENAISLLIPIPLYLGLMGTLIGIIIGLWGLPSVSSDAFLEGDGVDILINGVKIAMIASLIGLFFTTLNNGWFFRVAQSELDQRKNDFYTFIQTELMPVLSQDVSANLHTLYQNLATFNLHFSENVQRLDGLMNKNYDALLAQEKVLDTIQNIDLTQLTTANLTLFKGLGKNIKEFEKFNDYLQNVNAFVSNSSQLNQQLKEVLTKTEGIGKIANNFNNNIVRSEKLQSFLQSHFGQLEARGQLISNTVIKVEDQIDKSVNHLEAFIQQKIKSIKEISIKEEDLMKKEFDQNRGVLQNLSMLKNIQAELVAIRKKELPDVSHLSIRLGEVVSMMNEMNKPKTNKIKTTIIKFLNKIGILSKDA